MTITAVFSSGATARSSKFFSPGAPRLKPIICWFFDGRVEAEKTWLITGVSTGLGRAIAEAALAAGDQVIGTLRDPGMQRAFEALAPGRARRRLLDVRDAEAVKAAVADLGSIDVLVNNAGYGLVGAIEEVTLSQARDQLEVNFFGALSMIQAVLPGMRRRRSGHILAR